jgi:hypothetical protein
VCEELPEIFRRSSVELPSQVKVTTGTTNEVDTAYVQLTVSGGKMLDTTVRWLLAMEIDGTSVDVTNCTLSSNGTSGTVRLKPVQLKAGTHKVKIQVLLTDGTKPSDERNVTFQKMICCPCCLPPPCPPLEEVSEEGASGVGETKETLETNGRLGTIARMDWISVSKFSVGQPFVLYN